MPTGAAKSGKYVTRQATSSPLLEGRQVELRLTGRPRSRRYVTEERMHLELPPGHARCGRHRLLDQHRAVIARARLPRVNHDGVVRVPLLGGEDTGRLARHDGTETQVVVVGLRRRHRGNIRPHAGKAEGQTPSEAICARIAHHGHLRLRANGGGRSVLRRPRSIRDVLCELRSGLLLFPSLLRRCIWINCTFHVFALVIELPAVDEGHLVEGQGPTSLSIEGFEELLHFIALEAENLASPTEFSVAHLVVPAVVEYSERRLNVAEFIIAPLLEQ
mmetsp:Transcript_119972/g.268042  ORF Transcript_119972/g.268042 Transcript_119972/m.268042 type:complete len:275 (-) Transcript_119972:1660-2484(-)